MPKYGLIGYPIAHSLSPRLFGAAYGGHFRYDLLEYESFDEAFRLFMKSYDAVNVTAPFKEQAFERARVRSRECELIGAANILVKTPRGLSCFNSDCSAVKVLLESARRKASGLSLEVEASDMQSKKAARVLVVGCGGAGKAAIVAAALMGMEVTVMNRNISRALGFVQALNQRLSAGGRGLAGSLAGGSTGGFAGVPAGSVKVLPIENFQSAVQENDILIYTAPAPLDCFPFKEREGALRGAEKTGTAVARPDSINGETVSDDVANALPDAPYCKSVSKGTAAGTSRLKAVIEANYRNPSFTPEVLSHLPEGVEYIPGQQWLLQQALTGYKLMTGQSPDSQALSEVF